MAHQAEPKPFRIWQLVWDPNSIVGDCECKFRTIHGNANIDILRSSVSGGVYHRLLSNPVELCSKRRIAHWDCLYPMKNAVNCEPLADVSGKTLQRYA